MFGSLLERLGLGRREPLGRVLVRGRLITEERHKAPRDIEKARALQQKLREIR